MRLIAHELGRLFERDAPQRGERNRRGSGDRDGERAEGGQIHGASIDETKVELAIGVDEPDRLQFGDAAQGICDRGGIEAARLEEGRIQGHPRLESASALNDHLGHAGQS